MKTYENKEEMIKAMLDMDAHDIPDIIANGFDDTDDPHTTLAKMACNITTRLVENAGGEVRFDVDAVANDDKMDDVFALFKDFIVDLCDLVVSHAEITGIEVLNKDE